MQVAFLRDNEDPVGLDDQLLSDQLNGHGCEGWEDLVKVGGDGSQVIDDDDSNTHVVRQMLQQPGVGVEAAGRTANANNRKVPRNALSLHSFQYAPRPPQALSKCDQTTIGGSSILGSQLIS